MKSKSGFVSLEYILVFAGVLSAIVLLSGTIVYLYNKNIAEIDNQRLKEGCKNINTTIEFLELIPEGKIELEFYNLFNWDIEKKSNTQILLKNKERECKIESLLKIQSIKKIEEKQKITISKKNDILYIN